MNNKIILSIALSLIMSSFAVVQAEETKPADTPNAAAVKDMMLSDSQKQDAKNAASTPSDTATTAPKPATTQSADSSVKSATPALANVDFNGVASLRGDNAINAEAQATDNKQLPADRAPIMRNYFQQPPLIPHRIREYRITTNNNKCLSCHSWKNAAKARATKISQTHFADRDGNAHSTVAARRYFCTQCHVPQVDAKPLVENEFKPVDDLK